MSRIVAFWSPSGAGASTLLLNTAVALGTRHVGVVAADLNLTAPSLALYADLMPHEAPLSACLSRLLPALSSGRLTVDEVARRLLPGPGFRLLPGMLDVVSSSRMTEGYIRQLLRVLGTRFDVVLADLAAPMDSVGCLPVLQQADQIILVVGPELASRFHTRRFALPLLGLGWQHKTLLVLNRAGGIPEHRVAEEIGLPVAVAIPELKMMPNLLEAGQIAYDVRMLLPAVGRFREAVERLTGLVMAGGGVSHA